MCVDWAAMISRARVYPTQALYKRLRCVETLHPRIEDIRLNAGKGLQTRHSRRRH